MVYSGYDVFSSIYAVAYAVIGGVGYVRRLRSSARSWSRAVLGTNIFNLLHARLLDHH